MSIANERPWAVTEGRPLPTEPISGHALGRPLRVLHVTPWFYPAVAFGGPTFSTKAICDGLAGDPAVEIRVLTTDAASLAKGDRLALPDNPAWFPKGYRVTYARRQAATSISAGLMLRLPAQIFWADVVHLSLTYSFPTIPTLALCLFFGRPVVWSPRGALQATEQWAEAPRQGIKRIFERVCQAVRPRRTFLHVTSDMERDGSRARLPGLPVTVIPNGIDLPDLPEHRRWRPEGRLRLMFLSRLHEKKGLDVLLQALARLPPYVTLDIYGDGAAEYLATLGRLVADLGLSDRVTFHGHAESEAKVRAFVSADLFVLPTRSENFGIAVAEALAHGVPVVTTTAAPWQGLESEGCGLWIEHGPAALVEAIRSLDSADLATMGVRGRAWMERDFAASATARRLRDLYVWAAGRGPQPSGVLS